jgi:hypothetical protein
MKLVTMSIVSAALAAAALLVVTSVAAAPLDRCPDDFSAWDSVPGPVSCQYSWTEHRFYPAGTRCDFDVHVDFDVTAAIYHYDNPPRTVAHITEIGTATANGNTLVRIAHYTETASPIIVFTDHGLKGLYFLPGGGVVTGMAGFSQDSIVPPEPEIFHGTGFDADAFCSALA